MTKQELLEKYKAACERIEDLESEVVRLEEAYGDLERQQESRYDETVKRVKDLQYDAEIILAQTDDYEKAYNFIMGAFK